MTNISWSWINQQDVVSTSAMKQWWLSLHYVLWSCFFSFSLFVDAKFFLSFRMKHFLFSMSPFSIWIWIIHCRVWNRGILSVIRILTAVRLLPVICILSIIWVLIDVLVVSSSLSLLIRHWAAIPFFFHICLFNNRCDKRNSWHRIFLQLLMIILPSDYDKRFCCCCY